ncbi:MAG: hypothetical protein WDZ34_01180 [Candidatus Saccharimonadales bacterium]
MPASYRPREKSALIFILKGLIPYSKENVMLAFKPNQFFNELEKISRYKRRTLELAMREAERKKLIERNTKIVRLTEKGKSRVRPFVAEHLPNNGRLMVIFDIPEEIKVARARFRRALRAWQFEKVQQSVWVTSYDHRRSVNELVAEMGLEEFVQLYECAAI